MPRRARSSREQVEHALRGRRVDRAGRLVGEQQARLVGERARDRDALALAARELAGSCSARCASPTSSSSSSARSRRSRRPHAGADQRDLDVGPRRQVAEQVVLLEDEADELAAVARRARLAPQLAAVDQDAPAGRLLEAADQVQQRALARIPSGR